MANIKATIEINWEFNEKPLANLLKRQNQSMEELAKFMQDYLEVFIEKKVREINPVIKDFTYDVRMVVQE